MTEVDGNDCEAFLATEAPRSNRTSSALWRPTRLLGPLVAVVTFGVVAIWGIGQKQKLTSADTDALTKEYTYPGYTAFGYKDLGIGGCLNEDGTAPSAEFFSFTEMRTKDTCDKNPNCAGYSQSTGCRGAVMYSSDSAVVGGGGQPRDSHTWKRATCMQKDLDDVYHVLEGYGKCVTADGSEPEYEFVDGSRDELLARRRCTEDPSCKGYSASRMNFQGFYLWKEGNLKSGGRESYWHVCRCVIKADGSGDNSGDNSGNSGGATQPTTPVVEDKPLVTYTDLGSGKCRNAEDTPLKHAWFAGSLESGIQETCAKDPNCRGYSRSSYGGGLLWMEDGLQGGGESWGRCKCMKKVGGATPPTTPAAEEELATQPTAPVAGEKPTEPQVTYKDLGKGKCRNAEDTPLKNKWFGRGRESDMRDRCTKDPDCKGYSASRYGGGLLWMEDGLQGGGGPWGNCKCLKKVET